MDLDKASTKKLDNLYVCDLECDGFQDEATKIHTFGIGWKDSSSTWQIKDTPDYDNMKKVLENPDNTCIFHNGYLFDSVIISKILNIEIKAEIIDTLPISWVLFPNRIKEGLKWGLGSFGETYGYGKPKINDDEWAGLSSDRLEIIEYYEGLDR